MAIPSGYRKLTSTDIGKTFGVDLEPSMYFEGGQEATISVMFYTVTINVALDNVASSVYLNYGQDAKFISNVVINSVTYVNKSTRTNHGLDYLSETVANDYLLNKKITNYSKVDDFDPNGCESKGDVYADIYVKDIINKPIFKRVDNQWVKQTAFERVNGEWVKISTSPPPK